MPPTQRSAGRAPADLPGARTLVRGMPVRQLLRLSTLDGAKVLAGAGGLDRTVRRINMMTTPEIADWVQENELLLTTSYPLPRDPEAFAALVSELDRHDLAALAIKLGKYIDRVPAAVLRRADELGFPVLEIPHEMRFDDIVSQVLTDIANRQAAILSRAEAVNRAFVQIVLDGGGLEEITGELAGLLGNAVAVLDSDDRVLAATGLDAVRDRLTALGILAADGRFRLDERTELLGQDDGAAAGHAERPRIGAYPISTGALRLGRIVVIETDGPLPEDTLIIQERAATVAALDMTKKLAVAAVERKYQSDFLHDLLVGRAVPSRDEVRRGRILGWELDGPLAVIVAEPHPDDAEPGLPAIERERRHARLTDAWIAAVQARDRTAAAAAFGDELIAIVSAGGKTGRTGKDTKGVAALARDVADGMAVVRQRLCYGVSRTVQGLGELPEAYRQAGRAVKFGATAGGPGEVTTYDGLGVFRLLSVIEDAEELRSFVTDTLGPVLERGDREREDLLNTLTVLIDCNLNAAAAAKELHFHYNTVRYRIAKLERLLGPFTSDRHLCQRLSIALQIMQLHDIRP